jgi:anti-sigma B factor antagonist
LSISVASHRSGGLVTVAVSGEVDLAAGTVVGDAIDDALASDGVTLVQVDLSEVDFLDSSGIALLIRGRRAAGERGVAYRVTGANGIALQVLELTGVWEHLSGDTGQNEPATS